MREVGEVLVLQRVLLMMPILVMDDLEMLGTMRAVETGELIMSGLEVGGGA